jgi:hypothetical protein
MPSCKPDPVEEEVSQSLTPAQEEACLSKSSEAVQSLMGKLSTQLQAAMKAGGPESAVAVCQQVAQPITDSTNGELEGLTISRTSLKFRNAGNAPDQHDRSILGKWQALLDRKEELPGHELIPVGQNRALFYKPIVAQSICLRCHGDSETFSPKLQALLDEHYPDDMAHGYQEGDLRGAFRVVIDLKAEPFRN